MGGRCYVSSFGKQAPYTYRDFVKLLLDHSENLLISSGTESLFANTETTLLCSHQHNYLKRTVSPSTVISKSFRKVLNKYALLTLPCVVPLQSECKESQFYSLPFGQAVAIMY